MSKAGKQIIKGAQDALSMLKGSPPESIAKLSPARCKKIKARADELIAEEKARRNENGIEAIPTKTWNYRVLQHPDGPLSLHEVYYDEVGNPLSYTAEPVSFGVEGEEGLDGLTAALERALRDAKERPILDATQFHLVAETGHDRSK